MKERQRRMMPNPWEKSRPLAFVGKVCLYYLLAVRKLRDWINSVAVNRIFVLSRSIVSHRKITRIVVYNIEGIYYAHILGNCLSHDSQGGQSLYNGPAIRWRRESPGTVVCIRDAFYNVCPGMITSVVSVLTESQLPVRRLSHTTPAKTLDIMRKEMETFALVFPHVSFSLENTHKASSGRPDARRIIKIPKVSITGDRHTQIIY